MTSRPADRSRAIRCEKRSFRIDDWSRLRCSQRPRQLRSSRFGAPKTGLLRPTVSSAGPGAALCVPNHLDRSFDARKRQGVGLGLDRVARFARKTCPCIDPYGVVRPSPGSADLAFDEERAWPHAGRPKTLSLILARNEKLPLGSVEQKVGIAAGKQARGRGDRLAGANRRLVFCEQPLVAKWRSNQQQRCLEGRECVARRAPGEPCPTGEPVSGRRSEKVGVASSELTTRVGRVDIGS